MDSEFIFEGKKYISASRASKITGYNSDYIGQLCRKNCLDCRRVGRVWFVCEESLRSHENIASATPRGRIPFYKKISAVDVDVAQKSAVLKSDETQTQTLTRTQTQTQTQAQTGSGIVDFAPVSIAANIPSKTEFAFLSPCQDELSFVDQAECEKQNRAFFLNMAGVTLALLLTFVLAPRFFVSGTLQNPLTAGVQVATVLETGFAEKIISIRSATHDATHDVRDTLAYSAQISSAVGNYFSQSFGEIFRKTYHTFANLDQIFYTATRKIRLAFFDTSAPVKTQSRHGIVVLPSAKDEVINDQVKQYVADSFSDETEVVPDSSGNAGVIKPVFKNQTDQEYLYVVVPIKDPGD